MAQYLTIRSDDSYSRRIPTAGLVEFLSGLDGLHRRDEWSFEAVPGVPWVVVVLADCDSRGNYACLGPLGPRLNVVELICSSWGDPEWCEDLASRIAAHLGWEAVEEHECRRFFPRPGEGMD